MGTLELVMLIFSATQCVLLIHAILAIFELERQVKSLNQQVAELQNEFPDKIYD